MEPSGDTAGAVVIHAGRRTRESLAVKGEHGAVLFEPTAREAPLPQPVKSGPDIATPWRVTRSEDGWSRTFSQRYRTGSRQRQLTRCWRTPRVPHGQLDS